MCLETQGECDFDNKKNINAGLGADTMQPHSTQLRPRDCQKCHLNEAGNNTDYISAVYGWNANGFNANTDAYLNKIANVVTGNRGNYSTGNGFRIADDGIQHQLDHLVDHDTGYPLVYSIHVRTDDGEGGRPRRGYETYKRDASGPINKELIDRLERIKVKNLFQQQ
jgi:hypothetical protein